jgi:hypothetical protein
MVAPDKPNPIQLQKFLKGVDYPASKDELVRHAKENGADETVMEALGALPDRQYDGPNAVSQEFARG